jgi:hypothetical protein
MNSRLYKSNNDQEVCFSEHKFSVQVAVILLLLWAPLARWILVQASGIYHVFRHGFKDT